MDAFKPSTHPGVVLHEEFAKPLGLTQAVMARDLDVEIKTLSELYNHRS